MEIPILSATQISDEIKQIVETNEFSTRVVCFDFFDTLVSRSVPPESTKKIAANQLADLLQEETSGELLYQIRQKIERRLCRENHLNGLDPEFNLICLAESLYDVLKEMAIEGLGFSKKAFTTLFADIELAVEKKVQTTNIDVTDILIYCHDNGVSTAIVSDFYFPGEYFQHLITFHGLSDFVDNYFISADFCLTKGHNGRLFDMVSKKTGVDLEQMIMIGDNIHADGRMAGRKGLTAYCLKQPHQNNTGSSRSINLDMVDTGKDAERAHEAAFKANKAEFFPEMGLSLYFFIHNLFLQARSDRQEALFFCSKEGELLRKLFTRYQEIRFGQQVIKSHYLFVSRKATYICSCKNLDNEDFARLFVHYRDLTLLDFLQSLNFSEPRSIAICDKLQLNPFKRHQDLKDQRDFKTLITSDIFRTDYDSHRQTQKDNFHAYLNNYGIDFLKDGFALVDVGWKGSIQNNIYYSFNGKVNVTGYYIGLLSPTEIRSNNQKKGILFCDIPSHSPYIHVFNNNRSLFEIALGASHGSADGYFNEHQFKNGEKERQSTLIQMGNEEYYPFVTVLDLPEERRLYNDLIEPIQKVYLSLNDTLAKHLLSIQSAIPSLEWFAKKHARMVFRPRKGEIDFYSELFHLENFGLFEFTDFKHNKEISLYGRAKNFIALMKDPAAYLETGVWPPIILRRLGLSFLIGIEGKKRYKIVFGKHK